MANFDIFDHFHFFTSTLSSLMEYVIDLQLVSS